MSYTCYCPQYIEENTKTEICPLSVNIRAEKHPGLLGQAQGASCLLVVSCADPWELSTQKALQKTQHYARQLMCLPAPLPASLPFSGVPPKYWDTFPWCIQGEPQVCGVPEFHCWGCTEQGRVMHGDSAQYIINNHLSHALQESVTSQWCVRMSHRP